MSSLTSGSITFSPLIQGFTGLLDARWTARFVWIRRTTEHFPVRLARSKLPHPPQDCSAYDFADALAKHG